MITRATHPADEKSQPLNTICLDSDSGHQIELFYQYSSTKLKKFSMSLVSA